MGMCPHSCILFLVQPSHGYLHLMLQGCVPVVVLHFWSQIPLSHGYLHPTLWGCAPVVVSCIGSQFSVPLGTYTQHTHLILHSSHSCHPIVPFLFLFFYTATILGSYTQTHYHNSSNFHFHWLIGHWCPFLTITEGHSTLLCCTSLRTTMKLVPTLWNPTNWALLLSNSKPTFPNLPSQIPPNHLIEPTPLSNLTPVPTTPWPPLPIMPQRRFINRHCSPLHYLLHQTQLNPLSVKCISTFWRHPFHKPAFSTKISPSKDLVLELMEKTRCTTKYQVYCNRSSIEGGIGATAILYKNNQL